MGFVTIVSGIAATGHEYGLNTLDAALVLYWISVGASSPSPSRCDCVLLVPTLTPLRLALAAMSILTAFGVPFIMFTQHQHAAETMTAAWLLPIGASSLLLRSPRLYRARTDAYPLVQCPSSPRPPSARRCASSSSSRAARPTASRSSSRHICAAASACSSPRPSSSCTSSASSCTTSRHERSSSRAGCAARSPSHFPLLLPARG